VTPEPTAPERTVPEPTAPEPVVPEARPAVSDAAAIHDAMVRLRDEGHAILGWVADDAYPMNVELGVEVRLDEGIIRFSQPLGFRVPPGSIVAITSSYVERLPAGGFSERGHLTLWGVATPRPRGRFVLKPDRVWIWDGGPERLAADYERRLPEARRYFESLSAERGYSVRPGLSAEWMLHRVTRAPFLSATLVPVLLGMAMAVRTNPFHWVAGAVTMAAAVAFLIGLSVANGVFDPFAAAAGSPASPPQTSAAVPGWRDRFRRFDRFGRRGRGAALELSDRSLATAGFIAAAASAWVVAGVLRSSPELAAVSVVGVAAAAVYSLPPLRLVNRGLGELAVGVGFGPVLLFGAYAIQCRGPVSGEALLVALPVALLAALVLYVYEISTRTADAVIHRQTLPVRLPRALVIRGYDVAVADSGCVGIGKFIALRADVVILDIRLPDMDGFAVYDELIKHDDHARVIMITAFHDKDIIDKAIKKGVFKYIKKPIDMNRLDRAIVEAVKR